MKDVGTSFLKERHPCYAFHHFKISSQLQDVFTFGNEIFSQDLNPHKVEVEVVINHKGNLNRTQTNTFMVQINTLKSATKPCVFWMF